MQPSHQPLDMTLGSSIGRKEKKKIFEAKF